MIIHKIHDINNNYIVDMLKNAFSKIQDPNLVENYHPDYVDRPSNIFYILANTNRYKNGTYYVIENSGEYVLSAGWNEYEYDSRIALILTRAYINHKYRSRLLLAQYLMPKILEETKNYEHVYITVNDYNRNLYNSFLRIQRLTKLRNPYSIAYKKLESRGKMNIYFTQQHVFELIRQ